jgi:Ca-activated chloride channel family protein
VLEATAHTVMTFLRPELLWLEMLPLLLLAAYVMSCRRRRAIEPSLALLRARIGAGSWRRHVSPLLLLAACAAAFFTVAGPLLTLNLASEQRTLILAMDASGSMEARDIAPTRMQASQAAAKALVRQLPRNVRVGIVSYADSPQLVQPPTLQHDEVLKAIDRLRAAGGTAIGDAMLLALAAIFPPDKGGGADAASTAAPVNGANAKAAAPVEPGSYRSAAIVLLTDGQNSVGSDPLQAAQAVARRGVKMFTVGFGTQDGVLTTENASIMVRLDQETLQKIAAATHGAYFGASSGLQLQQIYAGLQSRLEVGRHETEVTAFVAAAAALLAVLGAGLSLCWFGRIA